MDLRHTTRSVTGTRSHTASRRELAAYRERGIEAHTDKEGEEGKGHLGMRERELVN